MTSAGSAGVRRGGPPVGTAYDLAGTMECQEFPHGAQQGILGQMRFGLRILASPVAGVKPVVGVHKERHPGQIAFELKQREIHVVHRLHADADELFSEFGDVLVLTDQLSVKIGAGQSAFASEHHKDRLA